MTQVLNFNDRKFYFDDTPFISLMRNRIYQVLLIASNYDAFILEDDGRIDEQIFNEYVSLNLRYPPQFIQVSGEEEARKVLETEKIDLIITMLSPDQAGSFEMANRIKAENPNKPIVLLTPFSREVSMKLANEDLSSFDYVFSWLGNADIMLAIIKLIEDSMNMDYDVEEVGVQVIILVEDSIRFYSSYLPTIYKMIFKQSKGFMTEGLNEHQQMLRMRGRPKILLATNFEDALTLYQKYKKNLLGVISDISFPRMGEKDRQAGIKLCKIIKKDDKYIPLLLQSSEPVNEKTAKEIKVGFINKNSKTLTHELKVFIKEYFAFGDFIFKDPSTGQTVGSAVDLKDLQQKVFEIPDKSLLYHITRNHLSKWLNARALFPIAQLFRQFTFEDFKNLNEVRRFVFDAIATYRMNKARGVIAEFRRDRFDEYLSFTRIGEGSIGGKARGLAFLDTIIKRNKLIDRFDKVLITIPKTVVLGTDVFDEFMEENQLYNIALSDMDDDQILNHFINGRLPFRIHEDLYTFISVVKNPVAVRSSSLLEDSHYQPFAGIYSTYMIPNIHNNERLMISQLGNAIKSVYASAFFKDSKSYMAATSNVIDEEKMGIVLQEVVGNKYGDRFYPDISGVARSINFYPIEPEKAEDGIANIALGLGKFIVDGGNTLRFSPKYPKKILQLSNTDMALKETQRSFFALDLNPESYMVSTDETVNLRKLRIKEAEKDGTLKNLVSTYDFQNHVLRDGYTHEGTKILTFSNILKHNVFPLAEILQVVLEVGQREMSKPVEIEFAVNLNKQGQPGVFNLLQIRPIVDNKETIDRNLEEIDHEKTILYSNSALGNGIIDGIQDFIYIKPNTFNSAKTNQISDSLGKLNESFIEHDKNYVLVGPGRWGSSDPWLGIPVKWSQISQARVIVESGLENYRIDPSQGTHFFQNLTSFRVGYFTINPFIGDGHYDLEYLENMPTLYEDDFIRHVRFDEPLTILVDGKKSKGVVMKMGEK
ncbi:MAG: phosphoenolpyruvate synthase [Bacteroidales bacterium]|nr:phosphoenolpyruvate synthase [Bacteroidales bacterium]